jgi:1-hydroxycarotenoid 3,4-desaturase
MQQPIMNAPTKSNVSHEFHAKDATNSAPRAVVIGAGMAGLGSAIALARAGYQVDVLEKGSTSGGKMRTVEVLGRAIDSGPTVVTMLWAFEELLREVGVDLRTELPMHVPAIVGRHGWQDGSSLDLFTDVERSVDAISTFSSRAEGLRYRAFAEHTRKIYQTVEGPFLRSQRPSLLDMVTQTSRMGFSAMTSIEAHRTLHKLLTASFHDPRLIQLFGRYATYSGSSPFEAPGTLALIAHVEREGVYLIQGGMHKLAQFLERVATRLGVTFHHDAPAREIVSEKGRVRAVLTESKRYPSDVVVFAGDAQALATGLLGEGAADATGKPSFPLKKRSLSAMTWSYVGRAEGFPLIRHNVFFSKDYQREFDDIRKHERSPAEPTVYVCAQDREGEQNLSHGASERGFIIVNAPAVGQRLSAHGPEADALEKSTLEVLARCGLKLTFEGSVRTGPAEFERMFPGSSGAIYGLASHGKFAPMERPAARTKMKGLYLASGSAHPGAGIAMSFLSGRLAAEAVAKDFPRTQPTTLSL